MVEYISSWARQVILAVIIAIILEMILSPNSKNTKYIKTVIGIYVMYTIIVPGLNLINGNKIDFANIDYERYFQNTDIYKELESNVENIENSNLEETYELNLKQDIENKLRQKGYEVSSINFEINFVENSEEYGMIKKIEIDLSKRKDNSTKEIEVNKIKIGNNENKKNTVSDEEQNEVKSFINKEYGVNLESIIIR